MPLYRRLVLIEVLADVDPSDWELETIASQTMEGGASGAILSDTTTEVDADFMTQLLIAQGSDPAFLIPDDDSTED